MGQILIIVMFAAVHLHDQFPVVFTGGPSSNGWFTVLSSIVPLVIAGGVCAFVCASCGRRIDSSGSASAVVRAERAASLTRIFAPLIYAVSVLAFGWLDVVRNTLGDWVALDELVTMLPALLVMAWSWWSYEPIERRLREASLVRRLDEGQPVVRGPTRREFVWAAIRHRVLIVLIPLMMLIAWQEILVFWGGVWTKDRGIPAPSGVSPAVWHAMLSFAGTATIFLCTPLLIPLVWDTVPLTSGVFLERVRAMCRAYRVRVGRILLWKTHGTMVNGAVMGLAWPMRSMLFTDALLDGLTGPQAEAVAAHEIAHVRFRHIPWLIGGVMGVILLGSGVSMGVSRLTSAIMGRDASAIGLNPHAIERGDAATRRASDTADAPAAAGDDDVSPIDLGVTMLAWLAGVWVVFGPVSRRFEWQADAFAVRHMAETRPPPRDSHPPTPSVSQSPPISSLWPPPREELPSIPSAIAPEPPVFAGAASLAPVSTRETPREADKRPPRPAPAMIGPAAIEAFGSALRAVASLNGISISRHGLRHGSIATRLSHIARLEGLRTDHLPIDREVRRIKLMIAAAWIVGGGASVLVGMG
ncbi:MAG: M48 family metalloprotease [Phycisphaerales bacterium]|nr:MAG: M48 family metalloprotease [Phycisphaerales bacterium]